MAKIILHLDMNSYFASVEQQANPHLRGVPVGVCEHLGGIIIAPSVEAKRLGIKLGTTVWDAKKLYPGIVLLPTDPDKYRHITQQWMKILQDYSDEVEQYSIDEAFIDITPSFNSSPLVGEERWGGIWNNALMLALEIKQRLRREVGEWVSASIGIGPNRLLAKIAADLDGGVILHNSSQPPLTLRGGAPSLRVREGRGELLDRICVITPKDVPALYDRLKLTDMPGIGKRLEQALNRLGIMSLKELAEYPLENLLNQFGIWGWELHCLAHFDVIASRPPLADGEVIPWDRRVSLRETRDDSWGEDLPKSIGHMYTLPKPISKIREIRGLMLKLAEKVGRRMRKANAWGNVVHYFHSDKKYEEFSKQRKLKDFINDGREIYKAAWGIYPHTTTPFGVGVKIMGLSVSGLVFAKPQEPLFEQYKKPRLLVSATDQINDKYGEFTVRRGRLLGIPENWARDTVGFGRVVEL